ncbi:MAG: ABC transporter substrate-binding protein [Hyphomicrobiaceae bacterium]|nr:ABC transporter substrate-binding protein [Hyphomicrobiaceae bacterium]
MRRRQFLRGGALAALATPVAVAPAIAQTKPELKWRLASSFGKSLDVMHGAVQVLCRYVAEASDNRFVIQPFLAGELAPGAQALDAVSSGSVECAFTPLGYYAAKDPTLVFGSGVPFGLNDRQQQAWWLFGGGKDIVNGALQRLNAYAIPAGASGTQMGGWFRKELAAVDDLKGLRVRITGMGGPVLQRLGAVPYQMTHADTLTALESGNLDAAEFICPHDDERLGFAKVARFNYYPCWWEGSGMLHMAVNLEQWNALPKPYQAILARACDASSGWMRAKYDSLNPPALRKLVAEGAILKPFPAAVLEACYKATGEHLSEIAGKSIPFKKALDQLNGFRTDHLAWRQIAEQAYDGFLIAATRGKT